MQPLTKQFSKLSFVLFLLAFLATTTPAQNEYKVRLRKPDGNGGLIVQKNAASRSAAETAALADGDASGDSGAVDVEKLDTGEAAKRGQFTQTTGAALAADAAQMVDEVVDASNSTTTPLSGSATFPGAFVSLDGYKAISVSVRTDQDSAASGLVISWSDDGTNVITTQTFTVTAASDFIEQLPRRALYYKVALTDGSVSQSALAIITRKLPHFSSLGTANTPNVVSVSSALPSGSNTIGKVNTSSAKTILRASIDIATSGDNSIISAPGAGNKIKIISIHLHNSAGTDNTVILKSASTVINGDGDILETKRSFDWSAPGGPGFGEMILGDNEAFQINLSASTQISGFVIYRIDN